MVLGKKVAIFAWEWGQNLAPRDGQERPCNCPTQSLTCMKSFVGFYITGLGKCFSTKSASWPHTIISKGTI